MMLPEILNEPRLVICSVCNGSRLPSCGPGLEPDRMVQSGMLPGRLGCPADSETGLNRTAVPASGSYHFGSD